jgi:hypothetical protein
MPSSRAGGRRPGASKRVSEARPNVPTIYSIQHFIYVRNGRGSSERQSRPIIAPFPGWLPIRISKSKVNCLLVSNSR